MTDQEIKNKYYEYKRRGLIRPPELITDEDWDCYYRNLAFHNEPSIAEMKIEVRKAEERLERAKKNLEKIRSNKYKSIEF